MLLSVAAAAKITLMFYNQPNPYSTSDAYSTVNTANDVRARFICWKIKNKYFWLSLRFCPLPSFYTNNFDGLCEGNKFEFAFFRSLYASDFSVHSLTFTHTLLLLLKISKMCFKLESWVGRFRVGSTIVAKFHNWNSQRVQNLARIPVAMVV
jgi:hypothetical protein